MIKILNGLLTLALLVGLGAAGLAVYTQKQFEKPGPLAYQTVFTIPKGARADQIAARLEAEGIVSNQQMFNLAVRYFRAGNRLKAGEYVIKKGSSMRNVLDILLEGKSILYKVTIPEGLTSWQAVQRINAADNLTGEISEVPPEGSILPDTYKFGRGMSRQELLKRMMDAQDKLLTRLWKTRQQNLPVKSKEEALILASIVEKETGRNDERGRVAGVFVNRLRKGMRLQSDPTIIYGIIGGKGKLGRGIRRSEIDRKTPFNTYQIDGLPPTPIANPGRDAIRATLNPAETNDLFFVADGTGGHVFASTLRQHEANVRNWRKIEKRLIAKRKAAEEAKARTQLAASSGSVIVSQTGGTNVSAQIAEGEAPSDAASFVPAPTPDNPDAKIPLPIQRTSE